MSSRRAEYKRTQRRMAHTIRRVGGIAILSYGYSWLYREMYGEPEVVYRLGFTLATLLAIVLALAVTTYLIILSALFLDRATPGIPV